MNTLLENPLPTLAIGAVLATFFGLVFLSRRSLSSLVALAAVVVLTLLLVVVEQIVVTESEEVEAAMQTLLEAVESNDLPGVLALIDTKAQAAQQDAEIFMPQIKVEDTGATSVTVELGEDLSPRWATARGKCRLRAVHRKSGAAVFFFDQVEFRWIKRADRWLLFDYVAYQKGKSIEPSISHLRAKPSTPAER